MLIEVLIAILILAFGIMGLAEMQARSIQYARDGEDRARAAQLADNITSQMWTQKTANLPAATITTWQGTISTTTNPTSGLPSGTGAVDYDATNKRAFVTVTWTPPGSTSTHHYQTVVQIPNT